MTRNTSYLNAMRAFAAFWVVTAHSMIWSGWWGYIPFPSPKIAVDIFIVLSGYLMALTVSGREEKEPMHVIANWFRFFFRRFMRIAPAYYLSLLMAVLLADYFLTGYSQLRTINPALWQGDWVYDPIRTRYTVENLLLHVTFLFGLFPTYSFSTFLPDWSIGLEMQFYVVFPAIFLAMRKFGAAKVAVALSLLSYGFVWAITQAAHAGKISFFYEPSLLFFRLPLFLAGMLIFEATSGSAVRWQRIAYAALALGVCAKMADIYGVAALWLVVAVTTMIAYLTRKVSAAPGWLDRVCQTRLITFMSNTSYSVYLFHGFFLSIIGSRIATAAKAEGYSLFAGTASVWVAVVFCTYAFAYLTYRMVELPGIKLGTRLLNRQRRG